MSEPIGFPPGGERKRLDNIIDATDWLDRLRAAESSRPIGRIGRFEILGEVGRGGQGIVYRAVDAESGDLVAVKRLLIDEKRPDHVHRRLDNEIRALNALSHPGIVHVRSVETHGTHLLLVMDWVDGKPLGDWADSERRTVDVVRVISGLCEIIQHAHSRSVIHRDLKPSNVMVDHDDQPRVLDFGLAKLSEAGPASMTGSVPFVGTLAYAAPEVIAKGPKAASPRSDLYALGVMLYELLIGRIPYELGGSISTAVDAILHADPKHFHWEGVDPSLRAILLKALAKDPTQRYPTVGAFNGDLGRFLAGERVGLDEATMSWKQRALVGVMSVAVAATLIVGIGRSGGSGTATAAIDMNFTPTSFLLESVVDPDAYALNSWPILASVSDRAGKELSASPVAEAGVRMQLLQMCGLLGRWQGGFDEGRLAVSLLEEAKLEDDPAYTQALARLGNAYVHTLIPEGQTLLERAVELERARSEPQPLVLAEALGGLALHHSRRGGGTDFDGVEKEYAQALELYQQADTPSIGWSLTLIDYARYLQSLGENQAALDAFERASVMLEQIPGVPPAGRWRVIQERGDMFKMLRRWPDAEAAYREAIAARGGILDGNIPALCSHLGTAVLRQDRPQEAIGYYHDALQKRLEFLSNRDPEELRYAEFATIVRERGLDSDLVIPIGQLLREQAPWILPLFQHTSAQVATAYELMGDSERGRILRQELEALDRVVAEAVPETISD